MRKIELKTDNGLVYRDLLKSIATAPMGGRQGLQLSEVRDAMKVADKLDAANGSLLLEEDEWRFLRDRVEAAPYTAADQRILDFADSVLNAPTIEVQEADRAAAT